jgi:hypothetical protein
VNNDIFGLGQNEMAKVIKDKILVKGDIKLLKPYLLRMQRRQSVADLTILAEFVQSKLFLEGSKEFQELIMEQFSIRKEKEVVWILAPLLKHKDILLAWRAREIMQEFITKDLGDDPEDWRAWYKEQNK